MRVYSWWGVPQLDVVCMAGFYINKQIREVEELAGSAASRRKQWK